MEGLVLLPRPPGGHRGGWAERGEARARQGLGSVQTSIHDLDMESWFTMKP